MDIARMARTLAPLVPYLLKGGVNLAKSAAGELGKNLGADVWDGLKALANKIRQKAEERPALKEALADAQATPQDEEVLAAFRWQLKKLLADDPELAAEAARLLAGVGTGGRTVIASGERSVAIGGDVSGSTIITGDQPRTKADKPRGIVLQPVESSMIHAVGYDPERRLLEVVFNSGRVYCYEDVPPEVYEALMAAESKGRFMRAAIIDVYPYRRGPC